MRVPDLPSLDALIAGLASSPSTCVLIEGWGAREVAMRIHEATFVLDTAPFLCIDCERWDEHAPAQTPTELVQNASDRALMRFARRGTIFFDEVSSLPQAEQARVAEFIDGASSRRAGAANALATELRIIAGVRGDALREVHRGRLRPDLHARLSVVPLRLCGPAH